jgi:hypothetical protein
MPNEDPALAALAQLSDERLTATVLAVVRGQGVMRGEGQGGLKSASVAAILGAVWRDLSSPTDTIPMAAQDALRRRICALVQEHPQLRHVPGG